MTHVCFAFAAFVLVASAPTARAQDDSWLDISGDVRLRFEQDWDSRTASGIERADRARARARARLNLKAQLGAGFIVQSRVRSGRDASQQNANVTIADFDDNRTDEFKVTVDQLSLAWRGDATAFEVGRMAFPFFTPNEYFWDGDIAPLGAAGSARLSLTETTQLKLNSGGFTLPVGLRDYAGRLYAGQAVVERDAILLAAGVFIFDADRNDRDRLLLLDGNGERDYTIIALNARYSTSILEKPLAFNADLYENTERYPGVNRNQSTGYVLSSVWGDTSSPWHWQIGYRYFRIERWAVNASYAHDDAARFGTASQAALTDLRGHDLYANVAVGRALTLGVRMLLTERISNSEDGKRARVDFTYKL